MPIFLLAMIVLMFWMSRNAKKQRQQMLEEQKEALVPGKWVMTRAGFYGRVVEIDGDVVTLETPLGDESLWNRNSILKAEEPPFADGSLSDYEAAKEESLPEYDADKE
ncbi:preprotein translocase subunit YajC [Actinomycetaceae bacterium TAE3-ERU4]|nr:preprotein translocase subunit YajC [Actinomycetaceae bacterium TAE3-ERU4]